MGPGTKTYKITCVRSVLSVQSCKRMLEGRNDVLGRLRAGADGGRAAVSSKADGALAWCGGAAIEDVDNC